MEVNLEYLRVGDTIVFADGTTGICSISYNNGGSRFIRWEIPNKDWSGSDVYCCFSCAPYDGKFGDVDLSGNYKQTPKDIVDIVKPPLHELQDEIAALKAKLKKETKQ